MPRARILTLPRRLAFTLTELLIAVGVLVIVVLAAAKIFSAASKLSAIAGANADLIQTATAIEQQIRADFANLPANGFMVIQQVEVNAYGQAQNPVVDPSLGSLEIRADQVAFFTLGVRATTQYAGSQEDPNPIRDPNTNQPVVTTIWPVESAIARVYYGHGVQAPSLPIGTGPFSYDGLDAGVVPWKGGLVEPQRFSDGVVSTNPGNLPLTKASLWPLVRLATLMGTDALPTTLDNAGQATNTTFARYGSAALNASVTLFASRAVRLGPLATKYPNTYAPLWTSGRVDVVKWQPDDLFSQMAYQADLQQSVQAIPFIAQDLANPWSGPSSRLRMIQTLANWAVPATSLIPVDGSQALYVSYPRVEKAAPSSAKADQMLSAPVLAANCSSFKVEWTWDDGVGRSFAGAGAGNTSQPNAGIGMYVNPGAAQPWFGLDNLRGGNNPATSAVRPVSNSANFIDNGAIGDWGSIGVPLVRAAPNAADLVCSVEGPINRSGDPAVVNRPVWRTSNEQDSKRVYQAVFGFNQADPSQLNPFAVNPVNRGPYTPLPSAIRITLRLHDPLGRIEGGREFQFIVDLPKR